MKTQPDQNDKPTIFQDDDDRLSHIRLIQSEGREQLASTLVYLLRGFEDDGCKAVRAEIRRFIELLIRSSETYRLALQLYTNQHDLIAGRDPADVLRKVMKKYMFGGGGKKSGKDFEESTDE